MTEEAPAKRPLFRPEAVAAHAQGRTGGRVLDLRENRVAWGFRGLLLAIAVVVLLAFTIRTGTSASGPVIVSTAGNTATLYVADSRRLPETGRATVTAGGRTVGARIDQRAPGEVLLVLDDGLPAGATGRAVVPLGEESVAALLLGWGR